MNLLFNLEALQPIHNAKFHGGGSYGEVVFWSLLSHVQAENMENQKIFCIYDSKKYLNPNIISACKEKSIPLCDANEKSPQKIIDEYKINTFYTPLYSLEKKWEIEVERYVFTWHGVRALEMQYSEIGVSFAKTFSQKLEALVRYREIWKKFYYKPKYEKLAKRIANGNVQVITVSEHSKASIKAFFPELMQTEIPVFYSPMIDEFSGESKGSLPEVAENTKYFLLTSGARWEKNNLRAVMAFDDLISSWQTKTNLDFKIIITGVTNKKIYTKNLRNKEHFIFLNYVENEQLEFLHKNAYAFIFPSLNEGFGYPPMQSMRYEIPVAASGTTSIPEICGDAALYFDPYSVSEIKNRIIQLLDPKIHAEYTNRAKKRYAEVNERQKSDLVKITEFIVNAD